MRTPQGRVVTSAEGDAHHGEHRQRTEDREHGPVRRDRDLRVADGVRRLGLRPTLERKVFHDNAARLLRLEGTAA